MRKCLLLFLTALLMSGGMFAQTQTENKAVQKVRTTYSSSASGLYDHRIKVPYEATGYTRKSYVAAANKQNSQMDGTEDYSVGAWINTRSVLSGGKGMLMDFGTSEHMNTNGNWVLMIDTSNKLSMGGHGSGDFGIGGIEGVDNLGTTTLNAWHYYLVVIDNTNQKFRFYLDGNRVKECDMGRKVFYPWADGDFHFGSFGITCDIDGIAIFNKALDDDEAALSNTNPYALESLASGYTLDEVAEGTTGQFVNTAFGTNAVGGYNAVYMKYTGSAYWGAQSGLVNSNGTYKNEEAAPTLTAGRNIDRGNVTFTVPAASDFANIQTLTFTTVDNEEVLPVGEQTLAANTEIQVDVVPAAGYEISSITILGQSVSNGSTFILTSDLDKEGIEIALSNNFSELTVNNENNITYRLTTAGGEEVTDLTRVPEGTSLRLFIDEVPSDVVFEGVKFEGDTLSLTTDVAGSYYAFTMPEADATLTIMSHVRRNLTVTIEQPEGGTVTVSYITEGNQVVLLRSGETVVEGTELIFSAAASELHRLVSFLVDGQPYAPATYELTTYEPTDDVTVSAQFEEGYCYPDVNTFDTGHFLSEMTVSDNLGNTLTITTDGNASGRSCYKDATAQVFNSEPGATVNFSTKGNGWYVGSCVFVDWGRNGFSLDEIEMNDNFSAKEGNDLVSYNAYYDKTSGTYYNSLGTVTEESVYIELSKSSKSALPGVTIPEKIKGGDYRMRYVVQPRSVDPCGVLTRAVGNTIDDDGGLVLDFILRIPSSEYDNPRTITVENANPDFGTVAIVDPEPEEDNTVTTTQKSVEVQAAANPDYAFKNWTNDLDGNVISTATYIYTGEESVTLTAHFGCTVNHTTGEGGTMTVMSGDAYVTDGEVLDAESQIVLTVTPETGMEATVKVNGTPVKLVGGTYTFSLETNTTIEVTFSLRLNTLTYEVTGQGSVECYNGEPGEGGVQLSHGDGLNADLELLYIIFRAEEGWEFDVQQSQVLVGEVPSDQYNPEELYNPWQEDDGHYEAIFMPPFAGDVHVRAIFTQLDGIESTVIDPNDGPVEYYTLQGVKVAVGKQLEPGIYIARQGKKVTKVLITRK
ncbi:MAG: LamG domain-containing protein [Coprobacter sp.]|nr:LamG domain-containing protein [Coprobacter sp.]